MKSNYIERLKYRTVFPPKFEMKEMDLVVFSAFGRWRCLYLAIEFYPC